jgi:hypothetical protein
MNDILRGIRPLDYVLTTLLVALAALIGFANVNAGADADFAHALDSHSALMIPVFVVAALPILWRRRNILAAIGFSFLVIAASIPMFGWVTRCGWALPLSFAMAYAVARFAGNKQNHLVGLGAILALQIVTLVKDASTDGLGPLVLAVPIAALFYGLGYAVESRSQKQPRTPTVDVQRVHA